MFYFKRSAVQRLWSLDFKEDIMQDLFVGWGVEGGRWVDLKVFLGICGRNGGSGLIIQLFQALLVLKKLSDEIL